jgi:phospholipase/carboxylesterase
MVLDVGLSLPLQGLCCLSGYLHSPPSSNADAPPPVFIAHGTEDTMVPIQAAQKTREILLALGASVDYHEFEMGHEIPQPVLAAMNQFIRSATLG